MKFFIRNFDNKESFGGQAHLEIIKTYFELEKGKSLLEKEENKDWYKDKDLENVDYTETNDRYIKIVKTKKYSIRFDSLEKFLDYFKNKKIDILKLNSPICDTSYYGIGNPEYINYEIVVY